MVNLSELTHVIDLLERYAARSVIDRALLAAGLDRAMLGGTAGFIPYAAEAVVLEFVARAIGDRHLGARVGRDFDYSTYGAYSSYVLGAPDLATALDRGRRALSLTHPGSEIGLRETDNHLVVGRNSEGLSVIGHQHLDEGALFVIGHVVRHFLGADWRPDWAEIPNASPGEVAELSAFVGTAVRVDAMMPAVAVRRCDLAAINPGPPQPEKTISLEEMESLMGVSPVQTMQESVAQMLTIAGSTGLGSQEAVARLLAIGARSLQRALKAEGTSFRQVRLRFVEERARSLLFGTDMSIEEVGKALGYTEPRSFRRAFNEWTGLSPSAFRAGERAG
ncbi:helix-turn-helix domain-containing protein [Aliiruegeria lutimaris]|uniref:Helix-turn-helix domain-containing protein n=1 Tax=Aliiruegeria lutimaris TaxID=571298 RepID=A0A1G8TBB6_9RHOB|nr:AraC family transcriptional regulator [Aliiruegeria lutimaris]SDJ38215.1 Helix-turn-helix domain-containing protein [Aliiruegeria lutimaris]